MDYNLPIPKSYILFVTTSIAVASAFGLYYYQKKNKSKPPKKWKEVAKVTELYIYPLKSGKRVPVNRAEVKQFGLQQSKDEGKVYQLRDRELVVYGEKDYEHRTARTYPKMVLIEVHVHDGNHIAINAPNMETLLVKIPKPGESEEIYIKGHANEKILALDCGNEAASWFSRYIQGKDSGLRLGFFGSAYQRDIITAYKKYLKFYPNFTNESAGLYSDLSGAHIVNQQSVEDLVKRIGKPVVSVYNFRPTIIVDCPAYLEDNWNWIKIGDVVFQVIKRCTRCFLTTIDQETGERNKDGEPLKTLKTYYNIENPELKRLEKDYPLMGLNVGIRKTGVISRGDTVYIGVE